MRVEKKDYKLFGLLGLFIVLAAASFIYQVVKGLSVTGLNEPVVWGAYIVNFTFCFGVGAGILMIITFCSLKNVISDESFLLASLVALVSFGLSGVFIMLDLGRIDRFYYMIIYAQLKSPLVWDFIVMNICMAISGLFIFAALRAIYLKKELRPDAPFVETLIYRITTFKREFTISRPLFKTARIFALLLIAGCYIITTEVFAGMKARPEWHTPYFSLVFFTSAIASGLAVIIFLRIKQGKGFLLAALWINLLVILLKYATDLNNPLIQRASSSFPLSLAIFLLIGNILPIILILISREGGNILYRLVPVLILIGAILKRAEMIIPAYSQRWLPFADSAGAVHIFRCVQRRGSRDNPICIFCAFPQYKKTDES